MTATLAAVASGAIGLEQAAALVIGQNIGTTPTAVAATIGAPKAAKRTALVHVGFNVFTAGVALLIYPWLLAGCEWTGARLGTHDAPTILALFHTFFNALGVAILLPLAPRLARLIERIVPERGSRATRHLGIAVARIGPVATEASRRAMVDVLVEVARSAEDAVRGEAPHGRRRAALDEAAPALPAVASEPSAPPADTLEDELAALRTLSGFISDEPRWVQAGSRVDYAVTAAPWLYCGTVESDAYFGAVHAFFHREKGLLRNVFECT
jgi:phosphate:Na+ symporter